jgi:hypothetical protein
MTMHRTRRLGIAALATGLILAATVAVASPASGEPVGAAAPSAAVPTGTQAIYAKANGRWVVADFGLGGQMRASSSQHFGGWEGFNLVHTGDGWYAIKIYQYWVTAHPEYTGDDFGMLKADSTFLGGKQLFRLIDLGGGEWALRHGESGLYVSAEKYRDGVLRARATQINEWEKFRFVPHQVRSDGHKPVYLVHGYVPPWPFGPNLPGTNCNDTYWPNTKDEHRLTGNPATITVGYYRYDYNCDVTLPSASGTNEGTRDESIWALGRKLSWEIYHRYSSKGQTVDVIAHSMGGLITRMMLIGVQQRYPEFAPFIFVEDVVTYSTGHGGLSALGTENCSGLLAGPRSLQCSEMSAQSGILAFMAQIQHGQNPQSDIGTDWTLVGSERDDIVRPHSAIAMAHVGHKVIYTVNQSNGQDENYTCRTLQTCTLDHSYYHDVFFPNDNWDFDYCMYYWSCNMQGNNGPGYGWARARGWGQDPVELGRVAAWFNHAW